MAVVVGVFAVAAMVGAVFAGLFLRTSADMLTILGV